MYTINIQLAQKIEIKFKMVLKTKNIDSAIYYPISLENQKLYKDTFGETKKCVNPNLI